MRTNALLLEQFPAPTVWSLKMSQAEAEAVRRREAEAQAEAEATRRRVQACPPPFSTPVSVLVRAMREAETLARSGTWFVAFWS